MIIVNSSTRQFNIPGADLVFGVTADASAVTKEFQCPRYVGNNLDLTGCFIRMNYRNANGEIDSYLVKNVTVDGDNVVFGWELSPKVTMYKGNVSFVMCVTGPDTKVAWHTTLGRGQVLEGLEPDWESVMDETVDVVAQLIAMVEAQTKAVADKGAEWVRNVQSEGTDQIVAVQTAARESREAAVAEIEAKGVSTLATIPGEYTATVNAVQSAANAIRGRVSGEVIRMNDVSPMEHYPVLFVHGKNLVPYPYKETTKTANGITFTDNGDGTITVNGTATTTTTFSLNSDIPLLDGKTYVMSNYMVMSYKNEVGIVKWFIGTTPFIWKKDYTVMQLYLQISGGVTVNNVVVKPQLERGSNITTYEPWVDPSSVTITRLGKNLLNNKENSQTINGITFTVLENGTVAANGTASADASFVIYKKPILEVGETYVLNGNPEGASESKYYMRVVLAWNVMNHTFYDYGNGVPFEVGGTVTAANISITIRAGMTVNGLVFKPMIRHVSCDGSFEPYSEQSVRVINGGAGGITSISPHMTMYTNVPGVNIECEYSRDTNAVIAEILEKITALIGG